jgi:hypothetical protein
MPAQEEIHEKLRIMEEVRGLEPEAALKHIRQETHTRLADLVFATYSKLCQLEFQPLIETLRNQKIAPSYWEVSALQLLGTDVLNKVYTSQYPKTRGLHTKSLGLPSMVVYEILSQGNPEKMRMDAFWEEYQRLEQGSYTVYAGGEDILAFCSGTMPETGIQMLGFRRPTEEKPYLWRGRVIRSQEEARGIERSEEQRLVENTTTRTGNRDEGINFLLGTAQKLFNYRKICEELETSGVGDPGLGDYLQPTMSFWSCASMIENHLRDL